VEELTHKVECRRLNATCDVGWHTIAAFNSEVVAERYASDCAYANRHYEYRVAVVALNDMTWGSADAAA
jgi:hypothetical protein